MRLLKAMALAAGVISVIAAWIGGSIGIGVAVQYGLAGGSDFVGAMTFIIVGFGSLLTAVIYLIMNLSD